MGGHIEELSDLARFLEFDLVRRDGVTEEQSQYALSRSGVRVFAGSFRECFAFLIGWRADRVDMIRDFVTVDRDLRQWTVANWAVKAFGEVEATSVAQRGLRLLEEAIEAFQACGGDEAIAHKLVTFVFARPPGTVGQELGGVAVTVLALAAAAGLSAEEEERREVQRVLEKPVREFTDRNANKNAAGFLIEPPHHPSPPEPRGRRCIKCERLYPPNAGRILLGEWTCPECRGAKSDSAREAGE